MSLSDNQDIRGRCTVFGLTVCPCKTSVTSIRTPSGNRPVTKRRDGMRNWESGRGGSVRNWAVLLFQNPAAGKAAPVQTKALPSMPHWPAVTPPRVFLLALDKTTEGHQPAAMQSTSAYEMFCNVKSFWAAFHTFRIFFFFKHEISRFKGISRTCSVETLPWQLSTVGGKPHCAFMGSKQSFNIMRLCEFS